MKKENKKLVLGIAIGGLVFGSIGVGAATYFSADQIKFTPTNESWNVDNAQDAMNDLYNGQTSTIAELNSNIANGKSLLADSITGKGVTTLSTDTFETMASNISSINLGDTVSPVNYYTSANQGSLTTNAQTFCSKSLTPGKYMITAVIGLRQTHGETINASIPNATKFSTITSQNNSAEYSGNNQLKIRVVTNVYYLELNQNSTFTLTNTGSANDSSAVTVGQCSFTKIV